MSTIENLDEINFEKKITKNGYGNFPYLLFKSSPATFTQIPIHFNIPDDCKTCPGTQINGISEEQFESYKYDTNSELHQILIERTKLIKAKIENDTQKPCRICLVESPSEAYYFEGYEINPSDDIPSGGTVLCLEGKILCMNTKHYL